MPHRAQLGFMAPGKAGAGTPGLARALSPRSGLAGGGRGCNDTGGGGAGARELASASALLPLINTAGRRGRTGAGTRRGRAREVGARAARRAPGETGCCAEAGSGQGCGARGACLGESRGLPAPGCSPAGGALERRRLCPSPSRAEGASEPVWRGVGGVGGSRGRAHLSPPVQGGAGTLLKARSDTPHSGTFLCTPPPPGRDRGPEWEPLAPHLHEPCFPRISSPTFAGRNLSLPPALSASQPRLVLPSPRSFPGVPWIRHLPLSARPPFLRYSFLLTPYPRCIQRTISRSRSGAGV